MAPADRWDWWCVCVCVCVCARARIAGRAVWELICSVAFICLKQIKTMGECTENSVESKQLLGELRWRL